MAVVRVRGVGTVGTGTPEGRPGERRISDEELAEFVRRVEEEGTAGAPEEPSARARMVTRRLRDQPEPEGWRTGPAWQDVNGRTRRRRRRILGAAGILVAVGLAVVSIRPELLTGRPVGGSGSDQAKNPAPLAPETARPTGAPAAEAFPDRPTLDEPFRGSPAAAWADGAAGIQLPAAAATGGMSKAQVAHALRSTRELLIEANLDPGTLRGERPTAALKLLDPLQKDTHGMLERALRAPSEKEDPLWMFSRFDPEQVRLAGDVVKTRGRMTYGKADRPGGVFVHIDFTFVYPVVKAEPGADDVARTIVRRQQTFALYDAARTITTPGRLVLFKHFMNIGNTDCAKDGDGYLRPVFAEDPAGSASAPSGPAMDPYDRSKDLGTLPEDCGTVTRT
ncbi:hypothetical protein ACIBCM_19460 [Streptomyces sp. NPDC051018]|uniref:hypothetical protein n=1 Tax=Streptomyces sp. NPDC051018 TaxID=3365639 RepID=UPI0037986BB1